MKPVDRILEACLYATDLDAVELFYVNVLGLNRFSAVPGRHVFFRCGDGMFLVFNPARTSAEASLVGGSPVPTHGATGAGHVAFAVSDADIDAWRARLVGAGVTIESEVTWPRGGRSLYIRDPAGNCVELASPKLWGFRDVDADGES